MASSYPKTVGGCVDRLYKLKQSFAEETAAIAKIQKKLDKKKANFKALEDHIFDTIKKDKLDGAIGRIAKVKINRRASPIIENREKLEKHLKKHPEDMCVFGGLASRTVKEMWEDGKAIPGLGKFVNISLSLNKV